MAPAFLYYYTGKNNQPFMSRFTRSWTTHLETDIHGFSDAFYKVVRKEWFHPEEWEFVDYRVGEDCRGEVYPDSFIIYRNVSQKSNNGDWVEGNISADNNGLTLELELSVGANYLGLILSPVFITILLTFIIDVALKGRHYSWGFIFTFISFPIYVFIFALLDYNSQRRLNKRHSYYKLVLNEIAKQIMAGKKN
jgi:hypothetical protein